MFVDQRGIQRIVSTYDENGAGDQRIGIAGFREFRVNVIDMKTSSLDRPTRRCIPHASQSLTGTTGMPVFER